jgi:two-component system chemotaxis response regulator CheB
MNPIRIVVVDDSPCLRQMLSEVLHSEQDFEVVGHGRDGLEAIALAQELEPDIVVLDIDMPEVNGIEALRDIRTLSTAAVVLLAQNGRGTARDIAYGKMLGAAAIVRKPEADGLNGFFEISKELFPAIRAAASSREAALLTAA